MSNEEQKSITPGIYLWLIAVNIYISMFAFGGGYVVVPIALILYAEVLLKRKRYLQKMS